MGWHQFWHEKTSAYFRRHTVNLLRPNQYPDGIVSVEEGYVVGNETNNTRKNGTDRNILPRRIELYIQLDVGHTIKCRGRPS